MKKILHISNWYPNKWNDLEAIFIKEQFDLFSKVTDSKLIHVEVRYDPKEWFKYEKVQYGKNVVGYYIHTQVKTFRIIELLTYFLLKKALKESNYEQFDLFHFHIAYPLLTYIRKIKKIVSKPMILSEHWSAFHYNFYMPKTTKKLNRIKNIFYQKIPLITVSKALLSDIKEFSGVSNFPSIVIPNVIDHSVFRYKQLKKTAGIPVFFIVNSWSEIKNPKPMLSAFSELYKKGIEFKLNIGGYGEYLDEIKSHVEKIQIEKNVRYLGKMNKQQIADQLVKSDAYLFSSKYETFSVICAEALSCGCPLIGPNISAIKEYANERDMINLLSSDKKGWVDGLMKFINHKDVFNRQLISNRAFEYLSHNKINKKYLNFISHAC